jgi:hypothetical protein
VALLRCGRHRRVRPSDSRLGLRIKSRENTGAARDYNLLLLYGNLVFQLVQAVFGIDEHQPGTVRLDLFVRHHAEGGDAD